MTIGQSLVIAAALAKLQFNGKLCKLDTTKEVEFSRVDEFCEVGTKINSFAKQVISLNKMTKKTQKILFDFLEGIDELMPILIKNTTDTSKVMLAILTIEDYASGKEIKDMPTKVKEFEAIQEIRKANGVGGIKFTATPIDVESILKLSKESIATELTKAYNIIGEMVSNDESDSGSKDIQGS